MARLFILMETLLAWQKTKSFSCLAGSKKKNLFLLLLSLATFLE
jgi:hypothetical protein